MVFLVVMYGCEGWTVKKAEHQRIDAFELWCWRRLLRVPWTARRSNQSILKADAYLRGKAVAPPEIQQTHMCILQGPLVIHRYLQF